MFWQEEKAPVAKIPDNVVDLLFSIECRTLPVDHAQPLADALRGPERRPQRAARGSQPGSTTLKPPSCSFLRTVRRSGIPSISDHSESQRMHPLMAGVTATVVTATLLIAAFAGPLYGLCERAAEDLTDAAAYSRAVLSFACR